MRKGPRKRQDILDTASDLFLEKGYQDTSIQDILDRLNTSKGSFYHHFKTKFEVLAALAKEQARDTFLRFEQAAPFEPVAALNALLKEASFLTEDKVPLLKNLMALENELEGAALMLSIQGAVREAFYPAFARIMLQLKQTEEAAFVNNHSLQMAFSGFLAACAHLFSTLSGQEDASEALPLIRAARRHLEAALGMRAGAVVILENEELNRLIKLCKSS